MIRFTHTGDLSKTTRFLERAKQAFHLGCLDKYGRKGVEALKAATPIESGLTANSWYYEIENKKGSAALNFKNSNVNDGVLIAIIIQLGHATGNGGWVEGQDYINPTLKPIFDELANEAWKEVTQQ